MAEILNIFLIYKNKLTKMNNNYQLIFTLLFNLIFLKMKVGSFKKEKRTEKKWFHFYHRN